MICQTRDRHRIRSQMNEEQKNSTQQSDNHGGDQLLLTLHQSNNRGNYQQQPAGGQSDNSVIIKRYGLVVIPHCRIEEEHRESHRSQPIQHAGKGDRQQMVSATQQTRTRQQKHRHIGASQQRNNRHVGHTRGIVRHEQVDEERHGQCAQPV